MGGVNELGMSPLVATAADTAWRFRAFISYAHKDEAAARWLHRALESYRVPARLVGQDTCLGPAPRRLGRFFRDRDELSAAGALSDVLRQALAESQFLIVIASRAAVASKWVNEEIRQFKLLGRTAHVLAFIPPEAEGSVAEIFPPPLRFDIHPDGTISNRPAEPVAADARKSGDGRRLAKLKLVAGLTCLPLDAIIRREAARRQRQLGIAAIAASALAIAMTFLAVAAVRGQAEAERQRAEADGLIEFMLTDLRGQLEPVGRLEVLDSVGKRALAYYSGQKLDRLSADELGRRARALLLVGEVRDLRGDSDGALTAFREAERTTAELLTREPDNPDRMYDHAQSLFHLGNIAWQRQDMPTVEAKFMAYDALAARMVATDPDMPKWLQEQSYAHTNLGVFYRDSGQMEKAVERFGRAVELDERLLSAGGDAPDSDSRYALAQSLAWWSDGLRDTGRFAEARAARGREIALYDAMLAVDPRHAKALEGKGTALVASANLHLFEGETIGRAIADAEQALALLRGRLAQEPDNQLLREQTVSAALTLVEAHLIASDPAAAAQALAFALPEADRLAAASAAQRHRHPLLRARALEILLLRARGKPAGSQLAAVLDMARDGRGAMFERALLLAIRAVDEEAGGNASGAAADVRRARALIADAPPSPRLAALAAALDERFPAQAGQMGASPVSYPVARLLAIARAGERP